MYFNSTSSEIRCVADIIRQLGSNHAANLSPTTGEDGDEEYNLESNNEKTRWLR